MGVDRIGSFPSFGRRLLERFRKSEADVERTAGRPGEGNPNVDSSSVSPADRAEISEKAREMMKLRETVDLGRHALEQTPEVRQDRVAEVKSRLNRGYYQSVNVHGEVADRLEDVLSKIDDL